MCASFYFKNVSREKLAALPITSPPPAHYADRITFPGSHQRYAYSFTNVAVGQGVRVIVGVSVGYGVGEGVTGVGVAVGQAVGLTVSVRVG